MLKTLYTINGQKQMLLSQFRHESYIYSDPETHMVTQSAILGKEIITSSRNIVLDIILRLEV